MRTEQLFRMLGGREAVMAITGQTRANVNHWYRTGVPYRYWPALRAAAALAGLRVTDATLQSTRPRPRKNGAA